MINLASIRRQLAGLAVASAALGASLAIAQESTTTAPAPAKSDPNQVVAEINGEKVTRQQVLDSASDLPPQVREQIDLVFPQLVERYIGLTLIGAEGRKQNLAEDPQVKAKVAEAEEIAIRQAYVSRVLKEKVTDAAIKAAYDEKVKTLAEVEEVSAAHILVASEDDAKAIIAELQGGSDFATIAKEKSTDKGSGANGGDLGWFTKEVMVKEFADAAFAMKPGEISTQPVKSQFGWHIIKLNDRRKKAPPSLEELRSEIQTDLSEKAIQAVVNDLRKAAEVKVLLDAPAAP
jgi:peptidyl-prolyl cis-trans isomerase C